MTKDVASAEILDLISICFIIHWPVNSLTSTTVSKLPKSHSSSRYCCCCCCFSFSCCCWTHSFLAFRLGILLQSCQREWKRGKGHVVLIFLILRGVWFMYRTSIRWLCAKSILTLTHEQLHSQPSRLPPPPPFQLPYIDAHKDPENDNLGFFLRRLKYTLRFGLYTVPTVRKNAFW